MGLADTELGLWAVGRPREGRLVDNRQLEETGGCGRRTSGVMMGGGPADVAGFHHQSTALDCWIGLAIDGWMINGWMEASAGRFGTVPRVRGGLGRHKPLVGRATGIRQQFLWVTAEEGPRVRHQQARVHIGVPSNTSIRSARATVLTKHRRLRNGR